MQSQRETDRLKRRCMICWNGEIEDEMHFMLDCDVYDGSEGANVGRLFARTCETKERNSNTDKTRHSEDKERRRRKKEAVGGSYWRCNISKRAIETFGVHFLQTSNETQEQSRSVCFRPNDLTQHRDNKAKNNLGKEKEQ